MDEPKDRTPAPEAGKPQDYSRYMPTLNRIYRRGNSPQARRLQDGAKGKPAAPQTPAKKDYSFWITLAVVLAVALVYWLAKTYVL